MSVSDHFPTPAAHGRMDPTRWHVPAPQHTVGRAVGTCLVIRDSTTFEFSVAGVNMLGAAAWTSFDGRLTMTMDGFGFWTSDWLWGLMLLTGSVVLHTIGLQTIELGFERALGSKPNRHGHVHSNILLASVVSGIALLHSIETIIWALAYVILGALPTPVDAIRFSLGAMTTSGADGISLTDKWKLLGGIEAMAGMLLFGVSTAFLFGILNRLAAARREARRHAKSTGD